MLIFLIFSSRGSSPEMSESGLDIVAARRFYHHNDDGDHDGDVNGHGDDHDDGKNS